MLTLYSKQSDFKKKLTVLIIWLVALSLSFVLMEFMQSDQTSFLTKVLPVIIGIFMIAGILLRCKIARGLTLITLYFLAIYPLLSNFLVDGSFLFFATETNELFSSVEAFLSNLVWALLFIVPIYFLSNNKSMDIFYIESNPKEHLFFIGVAIFLVILYVYFITVPFLEGMAKVTT